MPSDPVLKPPAERVNILGVGVHAVNMATALDFLTHAIDARQRGYVCVTPVHAIMEAQADPDLRRTLNHSLLTVPDGMPTVWIGKLHGHKDMDRVFGPELMLALCERSVARGWTHYLYGGQPGVAERLQSTLESRFPGIRIIGTRTPPFRPLTMDEESELIAEFERVHPDILWISLSTPKQDHFMNRFQGRLVVTLMLGVGAAFDFHTGGIRDAPRWVKRAGLQWLHRLAQEPTRLWRRYLYNNPAFIVKVLSQSLGLKSYPL